MDSKRWRGRYDGARYGIAGRRRIFLRGDHAVLRRDHPHARAHRVHDVTVVDHAGGTAARVHPGNSAVDRAQNKPGRVAGVYDGGADLSAMRRMKPSNSSCMIFIAGFWSMLRNDGS